MANFLLALIAMTATSQIGAQEAPPGQLSGFTKDGQPAAICPLKKTEVVANISGFASNVTVMQTFVNPSSTPIEAVYTFPLPAEAAVNRMRIQIGSRVVEGTIRRREEARRIYNAAKNSGQSAALLDQERPNIFTQSVANIMPGQDIKVEISYVEILKYEKGEFEFDFPMVVGPRFLGNAPDPDKIAPPITPKGTRTGSNIDLTVNLDAGAPILGMRSVLHEVKQTKSGEGKVQVKLNRKDEIPNRDFILKYQTATDHVQSAFVTNYDGKKGGFFSLVLLPPKAPTAQQITPREMVFVMDQSGSQGGMPIDKSKELTLKLIDTLRPDDTFNVFGFNNTVQAVFDTPRKPTAANLSKARDFIKGMEANGGTQLLEGLNAALKPAKDSKRLRMVVFNTDGYVGDEAQILESIQKHRDTTRIFTFGVGNSVNRFLIDGMSNEGRGASEVVTLADQADATVARFIQRTRSPVLTDVQVHFSGVEPTEVYPKHIPDVFSETPIVIHGRYENPMQGKVTITGMSGTSAWSKDMDLRFSADAGNPVVQSLWARKKVDDLRSQSWSNQKAHVDATDQIIDTALEFTLMTQYTSFVAVEPRIVNVGGKPRTVRVPVEMADGVQYDEVVAGVRFKSVAGAPGGFGGGMAASQSLFRGGAPSVSLSAKSSFARLSDASREPALDAAQIADQKIDKNLRTARGKVAIMVWLTQMDEPTLAQLKKQGFALESKDGKLLVVFGTMEAAKLKALAQLESVERIEALPEN